MESVRALDELLERIRLREQSENTEERTRAREQERVRFTRFGARVRASFLAELALPSSSMQCLEGSERDTDATLALKGLRGFVVFAGARGVGKTVAAVKWIRDFVLSPDNWEGGDEFSYRWGFRRKPLFVTSPALTRWDRFDREAMARLLDAPRLVVDDMGAEFFDRNGSYQALVYELVNERHEAKRPTLVTSNLSASDFVDRYGERTADRIRERGKFVVFTGDNLRNKGAR